MMNIQIRDKLRIVTAVFFITPFIFSLFRTNIFAAGLDRKLEELENLGEIKQAASMEIIARPKPKYKAADLRNPFRSPFDETVNEKATEKKAADLKTIEKPLPALAVQGVIWGGSFPQAIINDKVVKIGDEVEGARILEISKEGVVVFYDNRRYDLSSPAAAGLENLKKKSEREKYEGPFQENRLRQ